MRVEHIKLFRKSKFKTNQSESLSAKIVLEYFRNRKFD